MMLTIQSAALLYWVQTSIALTFLSGAGILVYYALLSLRRGRPAMLRDLRLPFAVAAGVDFGFFFGVLASAGALPWIAVPVIVGVLEAAILGYGNMFSRLIDRRVTPPCDRSDNDSGKGSAT